MTADWQALDRRRVWHPYSSFGPQDHPLLVERAEGAWLHLDDGRQIYDAISSWWVNLHGHSHPELAQALADQAKELEHVIFAGFTHRPALELVEALLPLLPGQMEKAFFSDNGSTAVEVGLKMAVQYWANQGTPRRRIVALEGAYHGDTFGAMSVGERGPFNDPFSSFLFDVKFLPFPEKGGEERTIAAFRALQAQEPAACFVYEPLIQGVSGMRMYSAQVLDELLEIAQADGTLCLADEVFTGFGRTGRLFAGDHLRHAPNLIALSKGLTGGMLPMGLTVCDERVAEAFEAGDPARAFLHGHSFTGNPLSCAVAKKSLEILLRPETQKALLSLEKSQSERLERWAALPMMEEARRLGTILAINLVDVDKSTPTQPTASSYFNSMRGIIYEGGLDNGVLLRPLGNVLYLVPPYCSTETQLEAVDHAVQSILETLSKRALVG